MYKTYIAMIFILISPNFMAEQKSGWTDNTINNSSQNCANKFVNSVKEGYLAQVKEIGDKNPNPFPESAFQRSTYPWCLCLFTLASEKWTLEDFNKNTKIYFDGLIASSLKGEVCEPTGILKNLLDRKEPDPKSI